MKLSKLKAKTTMRTVAGTTMPRQNRTSGAFRKALAASRSAPTAGVSGEVGVDGQAAKPRLDRKGRRGGGHC